MLRILLITIIAGALPAARAQVLVTLADGRKAEAEVVRRGQSCELRTPFGRRTVPAVLVESEDAAALPGLARQYAAFQGPEAASGDRTAETRARAQWCLREGYWSGLKRDLEWLLGRNIEDSWAREVLAQMARTHVLSPLEDGARKPGRERRKLVRTLLEGYAGRGPVEAVLAFEKVQGFEEALVAPSAKDALKKGNPPARWAGARCLQDCRETPARIRPLLRHGLMDPSPAVRTAAVSALAITRDEAFVRLYARSLLSGHSGVRVRAVEALEGLGLPAAIPHLIDALAGAGRAPRNNITVLRQIAYVKDFDVEIAQAAVIADPVVDVVQEGAVLDVAVVSINIERATIRRVLAKLSGEDHGLDVAAWRKSWQRRRSAPR